MNSSTSRHKHIDIRQVKYSCRKCGNKEERNDHSDGGICEVGQSSLDGLPLRCVGHWANEKIYYLTQYFGIFAMGMNKKWKGRLRYIELCSGPGRCSTRDGNEQDGTALAIVNHPAFQYVKEAIFIDYNETAVNTLNQRIAAVHQDTKARSILGDYNQLETIRSAILQRPFDGLTLCLVDPTDCSIPFSTIRIILEETQQKCDLIITFFDKTDFHRNAVEATLYPTYAKLRQKYENFLGDSHFFDDSRVIAAAKNGNHSELSKHFRNKYAEQLAKEGLKYQDTVQIGRLYHMLFATRHIRGMDFWNKAKQFEPNGQGTLPL